jgi:hypothetical protein
MSPKSANRFWDNDMHKNQPTMNDLPETVLRFTKLS